VLGCSARENNKYIQHTNSLSILGFSRQQGLYMYTYRRIEIRTSNTKAQQMCHELGFEIMLDTFILNHHVVKAG
jgi:hypothetical protein